MSKQQNTTKAYAEIAKRLAFYDKAHEFIIELAEWDATTDSWYGLFKHYQKRAKEILNVKTS